MDKAEIDKEFHRLKAMFEADPELGKLMNGLTFENLFNDDFLKANSKFTSMNDMIWRSGFGIVNLMEVPNVNPEKWDAYIAANTGCEKWFDFGKLAMVNWMEKVIKAYKEGLN